MRWLKMSPIERIEINPKNRFDQIPMKKKKIKKWKKTNNNIEIHKKAKAHVHIHRDRTDV